jgi:hypothetical protein
MRNMVGGARSRGFYSILASQYNSSGSYWQYQLFDILNETVHLNGTWVREKDLKKK